jgi:hypothetical protein
MSYIHSLAAVLYCIVIFISIYDIKNLCLKCCWNYIQIKYSQKQEIINKNES